MPTDADLLQGERERADVLLKQCDDLAAELQFWRGRFERADQDLQNALATIQHMERSKFWRIRNVWFRVKSVVGLG